MPDRNSTCLECSTDIYPGDKGYGVELCPKHFDNDKPVVHSCPECSCPVPRAGNCRVCISTAAFKSMQTYKHLLRIGVPPRMAKAIDRPVSMEGLPPDTSLYFFGPTGVGKTHKAVTSLFGHLIKYACSPEHYSKQKTIQFVSVPQLLTDIRNSFSKPNIEITSNNVITAEEFLISHFQNLDVLVFDELGLDKPTEWVFTTLYLIINYRYEHDKTTIFTSNYSLEALAERFKDTRLTSRIGGWCELVPVSGEDLRLWRKHNDKRN